LLPFNQSKRPMLKDHPPVEKAEIIRRIMGYMAEHPEAQDTLDGILHWWLLEREIKFQIEKVKEALSELVQRGLILEYKSEDSRIHYRMNKNKSTEIQALFRETSES